ncbi:Xaa-Pro dipeptidase [Bhargavaea cecembensis]|uniref:Xaa-Pro dipeptidase n=1 Tax=Bhargavaea cecembensis TaxID=394098 RepID=A0A161R9X0_9BACL|nr:Xaa-Pro peptidase family protein [Bhargavaea cecembensis]KZE40135.1 Xaa-Pro dipeptidase [Bhargavaea cecembensis]
MDKLKAFRAYFDALGIDGFLVTNPYSRRYLTGFTGSAGTAVISRDDAVFITDFRYTEQASEQVSGYRIVKQSGLMKDAVAEQVKAMGIQNIGFEQDTLPYAEYDQFRKVAEAEWTPVSDVIEKLRMIKTDDELMTIRKAAKIADEAFDHILTFIKPGVTELEVSNELEFCMRRLGAAESSFDTIVASGKRSALPHGVATGKVIENGDMVTLDFGALYDGYVSDITRTIAVGEPSEELKKIYHIVLEAQQRACSALKPGMTGREADAVARDYISEHGYGEAFGHSTGHGIGLEVHEGPGLSFRSDTVLEPGMVVTVEPGIYVPGLGGVRIEDDVLITEDGCELLTSSPKQLIIL